MVDRYGWMGSERKLGKDGFVLCSLVDGVDRAIPGRSFGHVMDIPDFGRIFLGELFVFPASVHLSMIRAELGCTDDGGACNARLRRRRRSRCSAIGLVLVLLAAAMLSRMPLCNDR